jgi:arylsulfatase A-like enzyme
MMQQNFLLGPKMYTYYDSTFGHRRGSDTNDPHPVQGYSTSHISDYTHGYIEDAIKASEPFFVVAAPIAPHESLGADSVYPIPETKHANLYADATIPTAPNFNPNNRSGVNHVWSLGQLGVDNVDFLNEYYRHRLRALRSVDDMVGRLVHQIEDAGEIDNTYIIYTSDNG